MNFRGVRVDFRGVMLHSQENQDIIDLTLLVILWEGIINESRMQSIALKLLHSRVFEIFQAANWK